MDRQDVDAARPASAAVAEGRFWVVLLLAVAMVVLSSTLILASDPAAPTGGWLWPIVASAASACWIFRRSRWVSRLLLLLMTVVCGWAVVFPQNPLEILDSGQVTGLDAALLGVGTASVLRCVLAAVTLAACAFSFGPVMWVSAGAVRWKGFLGGFSSLP